MGTVRLKALPKYLERFGVPYKLYPGWDTRARSSGGFDDVRGVCVHHTAQGRSMTTRSCCSYIWDSAEYRPIGNALLAKDGTFWLGSVGATNTQGKGPARWTPRGSIPLDAGNRYVFAIEAENDGVGERWTEEQQKGYPVVSAAVLACINETTPGAPLNAGQAWAHFETAPGRKFDPAGPSRWAPNGGLWRMDPFRAEVAAAYAAVMTPVLTIPTAPPSPPKITAEEATVLVQIAKHHRNQSLYAVYSDGRKLWIKDGPHWAGVENLLRLGGKQTTVQTYQEDGLFRALGQVEGVRPSDVDEWGVPKPVTA